MFYILNSSFSPNTAITNRMLAYIKGLSELNVDTTVVFFFPDDNRNMIQQKYPHISFQYMWAKDRPAGRALRGIRYIKYIFQLFRQLKKGDNVYLYNMEDVMAILLWKKGINIYAERGEHPQIYPLGSPIYRPSLKRYFKQISRIDGLFVISQALKYYYVENGMPEEKVHVINIIVDPSRFDNITDDVQHEDYIAYCGTASNNKDGVDELIKAFAITSLTHPDLKLFIIGKTPSSNDESKNLQLIEDLGIKDKIVFTGVVSAEKMPTLLSNAKVLALDRPDNLQAKYGFPTKLGEYLLTRKPVVITRVGDIPLFLHDNYSAYIANPQDKDSFSNKLNYVLDNYQEALAVGQKGYEVALKEFSYLTETKKMVSYMLR